MSLWRCKGEQNRKIHNFIFHVGFPALKCFKNTCFTLDLEVGTFLYDMVPVSATYVPTVSEHQHQSWKMPENDHFCTGGVTTLHVTRASLWTEYYTPGKSLLYRMAFTSCRWDRPSQSNRSGIRAALARFSPFSIFPLRSDKHGRFNIASSLI